MNISDDQQVRATIAGVADHFGSIDYLVNLACTYTASSIEASCFEWQRALHVDVTSTVMMACAVLECPP